MSPLLRESPERTTSRGHDDVLGDAFRYVAGGPTWGLAAASTAALVFLTGPLAIGGVPGTGTVWTVLYAALLAAVALPFRARLLHGEGVRIRDVVNAAPESWARTGRAFGVTLGPGVLLSILFPLTGGMLAVVGTLWLAACLREIVHTGDPAALHPGAIRRRRTEDPTDFWLVLAMTSLTLCAVLATMVLVRGGAWTAVVGTAGSVLTGMMTLYAIMRE